MHAWIAACLIVVAQQSQAGIPSGSSKIELDVSGLPIEVFTYKPASYKDGPLLLVLHGTLRNAEEYRDDARGMGDRFGALIAARKFDGGRFPNRKYQRGGLLEADGKTVAPRESWTWSLVPKIADALRRRAGRPGMPYDIIGHSAGGQFVGRMSAFVDTGARRIVAANPSAWVFPTREMPFGYGFGNLPDELADDDHLRRYLGRPLTVYLGEKDTERDEDLDKSPEADRQGKSRRERGRAFFAEGERLAKEQGWDFGWRLVEAPGVGHDHQAMFDSPACEEALFERRAGGESAK